MKKCILLIACLATNILVFGQWTDDTSVNTKVATDSPQANRTVAGSNGNTYNVFWNSLAGSENNYDLRLQILDPTGVPQFDTDGMVISSSIPMSTFTQIFSLTIDPDDNLYVGCTGTNGNTGYAFKLDSQGNNLWGSDGVELGEAYLVRMKPLSSGDVIISWLDADFNGNIQKFDSDGNAVWSAPVGIPLYAPAQTFELSDGGNITIYHNKISFGINSIDYAQRYDADGVAQWDAPVQLFETSYNTVYNGSYSAYQEGDTIFYSYKLAHSNRFDAYLQRINPDGSLPWGINGSDFDTNQTDYEQEIQIAATPESDHIWAVCRYTDSSQGQVGIYVQKFNKVSGARLLTDNAKELYPLSTGDATMNPAGTLRLYNDQPMLLTLDGSFAIGNHLYINLIDENGDFAWPEHALPVGTFNAVKSRIELIKTSETDFVTTFIEDKGDGDMIYAQHIQNNPVGIENIVANEHITFANPVQDRLTVNSDRPMRSISIYTVEGQLVYQKFHAGSNQLIISASQWQPGIYLGIITTEDGLNQSIKVVKL